MKNSRRIVTQFLLFIVVLILWELVPLLFELNQLVLPRFSFVVQQLGAPLTGSGTLWSNTLVTVVEVLGAFGLAAVAGVMIGIPFGLAVEVRTVALPLLTAAFAVPIMTLIPLFLVTFGLGMGSKIAFVALYAFFPILFNTVSGTGNIDRVFFDVADAFGLSRFDRLRRIVLRSAARNILNGLQIGLAIAIIAAISIEMFGSVAGPGFFVHRAGQRMRMAEVYAIILVILLVACVMMSPIKLVARLLDIRLEMSAG